MQIYPAIWDTVAIVTHPHAHLQAASQSQSQSLSLSSSSSSSACFLFLLYSRLYVNFLYAYSHRGTKPTRPVAQRRPCCCLASYEYVVNMTCLTRQAFIQSRVIRTLNTHMHSAFPLYHIQWCADFNFNFSFILKLRL